MVAWGQKTFSWLSICPSHFITPYTRSASHSASGLACTTPCLLAHRARCAPLPYIGLPRSHQLILPRVGPLGCLERFLLRGLRHLQRCQVRLVEGANAAMLGCVHRHMRLAVGRKKHFAIVGQQRIGRPTNLQLGVRSS